MPTMPSQTVPPRKIVPKATEPPATPRSDKAISVLRLIYFSLRFVYTAPEVWERRIGGRLKDARGSQRG